MLPSLEEHEIAPEQLRNLLDANGDPDIRLVDCREEDEFALCRIEGARLAPLSRFAEEARTLLNEEDSRPIVIYCHHGMRSMNATLFLRHKGNPEVWSLAGGIDRWSSEIDSTVARY